MLLGFWSKGRSRIRVWCVVQVPLIGVQGRIVVEPVNRSMIAVSRGLVDKIYLPAGRAPKGGVVVCQADTKFLDFVHANGDYRGLLTPTRDHVIGDIDSVQVEGVLIAACPGNGSAGIPKACLSAVIRGGTGLEREQFARVSVQCWQVRQNGATDDVPDHGIHGLQLCLGFRSHLHDLSAGANFQSDVERIALGNVRFDGRYDRGCETPFEEFQGEGAGSYVGKNVLTC